VDKTRPATSIPTIILRVIAKVQLPVTTATPTAAVNLTPTKERRTSEFYSPAVSPAQVWRRSSEELEADDLKQTNVGEPHLSTIQHKWRLLHMHIAAIPTTPVTARRSASILGVSRDIWWASAIFGESAPAIPIRPDLAYTILLMDIKSVPWNSEFTSNQAPHKPVIFQPWILMLRPKRTSVLFTSAALCWN
jgi:hypothetical protein